MIDLADCKEEELGPCISEDSDPEEKVDSTTTKHVVQPHQRCVITSVSDEDMQGVHI